MALELGSYGHTHLAGFFAAQNRMAEARAAHDPGGLLEGGLHPSTILVRQLFDKFGLTKGNPAPGSNFDFSLSHVKMVGSRGTQILRALARASSPPV